ncbi:MAG TPA: ABC transporter permease [Pseudonocardiaceae bacterium]|nr:ABC transporter permease [Pseudonocardiaceae bacterium]
MHGAWTLLRSPLMIIGVMLITILVLVGVFAPLIAPYDPEAVTGPALQQPSGAHWLGTDVPGRDIFSQLVYGARASLVVALVGSSLALIGGILLGALPALLGGRTDTLSNRLVVFMLALPSFALLVLIGALAGPNEAAIILVVSFTGIAPNARILRSQALTLRDAGYVTAARGFGGGRLYVLRRHLLPGMGPQLAVRWVEWASTAVALQAALAFLGLGNPSTASWGLMINRALAQSNIYFSPMWVWWVLPAGFAVTLTILGFAFVGIAVEPAFNPRWLRSS